MPVHVPRPAFEIRDALFTAYIAALLIVTMPPVWVMLLLVPAGRTAGRLVRGWSRLVVRASLCRMHVTGANRLRGAGAAAFVSNHVSYIDSVVLMATLPADCRFVAEHGVVTWFMIGTAVRKAGHLTVDRGSRAARAACTHAMTEMLRAGASLLVYPEGRRSREEGLLPFHLGAFRAAVGAGRPVVPITVGGTDTIVSTSRRWLRRGPIDVTIHPPIEPRGRDRDEMARVREQARADIASSLGEPHKRHRDPETLRK